MSSIVIDHITRDRLTVLAQSLRAFCGPAAPITDWALRGAQDIEALLSQVPTPDAAAGAPDVYVTFSDSGSHLRMWKSDPFPGAHHYRLKEIGSAALADVLMAARELETAAECVECSTPNQMTESAARLRRARLSMNEAVNQAVRASRAAP